MALMLKKDIPKTTSMKTKYVVTKDGERIKKEIFVGSFKGHVRKMRALYNSIH